MTSPRFPLEGVVYHPPEAVDRYRRQGLLRNTTLGEALHDSFGRWAEREAVISPDGRTSYLELDEITDRVATAFLRLGLRPLDRVIFQLGNVPEVLYCVYGCFKAGIIPVCTLASHREQEIEFIAELTEACAHIVQGDLKYDMAEFGRGMARRVSSLNHLIVARGAGGPDARSLAELIDAEDPVEARRTVEALDLDPFNVAAFQLSGGTTGIPKVIPRFHSEYLHNMLAWAETSGWDETVVSYWPLPAIHNAAMACLNTPAHLAGGKVCIQQAHDPEAFLGMIERERVTVSGGSLPIVVRAVDSGKVTNHDLSSVTCFITLGEAPLVEKDLKLPGIHIFGMAEGICMRTLPDDADEVRMGGIGRPISPGDEVRLVEPGTETDVAPGEIGEFLARGPYTVRGYYKAEEHNAKAFTSDGFYRSGDLMRAHTQDGRVWYSFEGRLKDNIDRGAEKINAEEVERCVLRHPDICECMAIGMPDREFGERVCVYVILEPDREAPTVATLGGFLETAGLAKFKWPERIEVVENFPVTKVGKTSKGLLRDDIAQKLEAEEKARTQKVP